MKLGTSLLLNALLRVRPLTLINWRSPSCCCCRSLQTPPTIWWMATTALSCVPYRRCSRHALLLRPRPTIISTKVQYKETEKQQNFNQLLHPHFTWVVIYGLRGGHTGPGGFFGRGLRTLKFFIEMNFFRIIEINWSPWKLNWSHVMFTFQLGHDGARVY